MRHHYIEFVQRTSAGITMVFTDAGAISAIDAVHQINTLEAAFTSGPCPQTATSVRALPLERPSHLFVNWDGTRRKNLHDIAVIQEPIEPRRERSGWATTMKRTLRAIAGATCIALTAASWNRCIICRLLEGKTAPPPLSNYPETDHHDIARQRHHLLACQPEAENVRVQ